jgi:hypothetical protein
MSDLPNERPQGHVSLITGVWLGHSIVPYALPAIDRDPAVLGFTTGRHNPCGSRVRVLQGRGTGHVWLTRLRPVPVTLAGTGRGISDQGEHVTYLSF